MGLLWLCLPEPASAQGKLEAQYEASLAGIPVGRGAWTSRSATIPMSAAAQGGTTGLLKTISNGSGTGAAQGRVVNGALVPQAYQASTTTSKKSETIHITLANGNVKDFGIEPEPPVDPDRIPVTDAHKKGVLDPMTSTLVRVPGTGEVVTPEACRARCRRVRRPPALRAEARFQAHGNGEGGEGLSRPGRGLRALFHADRGLHPRPSRDQISRRPRATSRSPWRRSREPAILVPFRTVIPTPLGTAVLEATHFVTQAMPPHVAKTQ